MTPYQQVEYGGIKRCNELKARPILFTPGDSRADRAKAGQSYEHQGPHRKTASYIYSAAATGNVRCPGLQRLDSRTAYPCRHVDQSTRPDALRVWRQPIDKYRTALNHSEALAAAVDHLKLSTALRQKVFPL